MLDVGLECAGWAGQARATSGVGVGGNELPAAAGWLVDAHSLGRVAFTNGLVGVCLARRANPWFGKGVGVFSAFWTRGLGFAARFSVIGSVLVRAGFARRAGPAGILGVG